MLISTSAQNEDKQKQKASCMSLHIFQSSFQAKDLLRLVIHVNNSQYLWNFCRTLLVPEDFL